MFDKINTKLIKEPKEKEYNKMSKKEFVKEWFRSTVVSVTSIVLTCMCLVVVIAYVQGDVTLPWNDSVVEAEFYNVNAFESEIKQDYQIKVDGEEMDLLIEVQYDDLSWNEIGTFHLEFNRITIFDGSVPHDAFVLYYTPAEWYTKVASDRVKYEEIHVPIEKQKVGVDPTFYRDEDFPSEFYPYDEIEITTNKVIKIVNKNETIYDFYVRVLETEENFNVLDMRVSYQ